MVKKRKQNVHSTWRSFQEARAFVHKLGLKRVADWNAWAKSNVRPDDIPAAPHRTYRGKGWRSWGDWLGTGRVANQNQAHRAFHEARSFVHGLELQSKTAWSAWAKSDRRPNDIPASPDRVYKDKGWAGWGDWLGTERIATFKMIYRSFQEARTFVRSLGLQSGTAWRAWAKSDARPNDIPIYPEAVYENQGWVGMGDWLGTGRVAYQDRVFRPFEDARAFVRGLGLKNVDDWKKWSKTTARPDDIPTNPNNIYKKLGWKNWADWLGTQNWKGGFRSFREARAIARSLSLQNREDWIRWARSDACPEDIPASPQGVYKNQGWMGWGDWLGTGRIASADKTYRPFQDARAFVHNLGLKKQSDWRAWAKSISVNLRA